MVKLPMTIALMLTATVAAQAGAATLTWHETTPERSDDVLLNPGMGLYLQHPPLDAAPDEWFMQVADVAYGYYSQAMFLASSRLPCARRRLARAVA